MLLDPSLFKDDWEMFFGTTVRKKKMKRKKKERK